MAIVVFLPALALSTITGINVYASNGVTDHRDNYGYVIYVQHHDIERATLALRAEVDMLSIGSEVEEAAQMLGASPLRAIVDVVVPLMKSGILAGMLLVLAFGELLVNSQAIVVKYEGQWYFPTYTAFHPGTDFGFDYSYEVNYRDLHDRFAEEGSDNWI